MDSSQAPSPADTVGPVGGGSLLQRIAPEAAAPLLILVASCFLLHSLFASFFVDLTTYGSQDWDVSSVYRLAPLVHLQRYHEGPWWNPWMCGGFPDWGYAEGATSLISPFLPAYLFLPLPLAERIEVIGDTALCLWGTWLLAGRVTSLASVRWFCAAVFALNGRWAMQAAVGHTWHLQYAWMPLVLYCYWRAQEEDSLRWALGASAALAQEIYLGGLYPAPHTALLLVGFGLTLAAASHHLKPLAYVAVVGAAAAGLAAPKLAPVLMTMRRFPREIESVESWKISDLWASLVTRGQLINQGPVVVHPYRWHEYGTYVGWPAAVVMGAFLLIGWERREAAFRFMALGLFTLSLGAFSSLAPWTWLHQLPLFRSQHVPSRFTQPALLVAALGVGLVAERWSRQLTLPRRSWLDLALLVPVLAIAADMVFNEKPSMAYTFRRHVPEITSSPAFHHGQRASIGYIPPSRNGSMALAVSANLGVIDCYGYPSPAEPRPPDDGALAEDTRALPGPAFVADEKGEPTAEPVEVAAWSPNSATLRLSQPHPGALLVYDMNDEPGWSTDGEPALDSRGRPAARLTPGQTEARFSYWPPGLDTGLAIGLLTLLGCLGAAYRRHRLFRPAG